MLIKPETSLKPTGREALEMILALPFYMYLSIKIGDKKMTEKLGATTKEKWLHRGGCLMTVLSLVWIVSQLNRNRRISLKTSTSSKDTSESTLGT